ILTLSQHQKYFAVQDEYNNLKNHFAFISNGNPNYSDIIRKGNEKVVKARLEDAEFYYNEDSKQPLDKFVPKLKNVLFQAKLGSLLEKTQRIEKLVEYLAEILDINQKDKKDAMRTAYLCKADLVTSMLGEKEFTKLQGYMGSKYARLSGENPIISTAIYEHYLPRGQNDKLPQTLAGSLVAIADKMDSVCGIIGVGLIPSGSNDPFALRRAANGIVQIIDFKYFNINLLELINKSFSFLEDKLEHPDFNKKIVIEFFKQRVNWMLQQANIEYDVIKSVMHIDFSNITDLKQRALDLQEFKQREDFIKLVLGFKRVSNIIMNQTISGEVNHQLLIEHAEKILYEKYIILSQEIKNFLLKKDYKKVMEKLVYFREYIDNFFDDVLVNTDELNLRENRYKLLNNIRKLFLKVADIAKIVV
ncbi:MAG: glycine--tRNA ligase subunit beta, partial [Bacteroidetes bacterium]